MSSDEEFFSKPTSNNLANIFQGLSSSSTSNSNYNDSLIFVPPKNPKKINRPVVTNINQQSADSNLLNISVDCTMSENKQTSLSNSFHTSNVILAVPVNVYEFQENQYQFIGAFALLMVDYNKLSLLFYSLKNDMPSIVVDTSVSNKFILKDKKIINICGKESNRYNLRFTKSEDYFDCSVLLEIKGATVNKKVRTNKTWTLKVDEREKYLIEKQPDDVKCRLFLKGSLNRMSDKVMGFRNLQNGEKFKDNDSSFYSEPYFIEEVRKILKILPLEKIQMDEEKLIEEKTNNAMVKREDYFCDTVTKTHELKSYTKLSDNNSLADRVNSKESDDIEKVDNNLQPKLFSYAPTSPNIGSKSQVNNICKMQVEPEVKTTVKVSKKCKASEKRVNHLYRRHHIEANQLKSLTKSSLETIASKVENAIEKLSLPKENSETNSLNESVLEKLNNLESKLSMLFIEQSGALANTNEIPSKFKEVGIQDERDQFPVNLGKPDKFIPEGRLDYIQENSSNIIKLPSTKCFVDNLPKYRNLSESEANENKHRHLENKLIEAENEIKYLRDQLKLYQEVEENKKVKLKSDNPNIKLFKNDLKMILDQMFNDIMNEFSDDLSYSSQEIESVVSKNIRLLAASVINRIQELKIKDNSSATTSERAFADNELYYDNFTDDVSFYDSS